MQALNQQRQQIDRAASKRGNQSWQTRFSSDIALDDNRAILALHHQQPAAHHPVVHHGNLAARVNDFGNDFLVGHAADIV